MKEQKSLEHELNCSEQRYAFEYFLQLSQCNIATSHHLISRTHKAPMLGILPIDTSFISWYRVAEIHESRLGLGLGFVFGLGFRLGLDFGLGLEWVQGSG